MYDDERFINEWLEYSMLIIFSATAIKLDYNNEWLD